jgi:hypothetical protein
MKVLNPEAIGNPNLSPVVQLSEDEATAFRELRQNNPGYIPHGIENAVPRPSLEQCMAVMNKVSGLRSAMEALGETSIVGFTIDDICVLSWALGLASAEARP